MIAYEAYKLMHILGIILLFIGISGMLFASACTATPKIKIRFLGLLTHGLGLLLILTGGFGMAARLGLTSGLPAWIYAKLAIWVFFGLAISLSKRKASWATSLVIVYTTLGSAAAYFAIYKPF